MVVWHASLLVKHLFLILLYPASLPCHKPTQLRVTWHRHLAVRTVLARPLQIPRFLARRFLLKPKCPGVAWIHPWKTSSIATLEPRKILKLIWSCWICPMWTWSLCIFLLSLPWSPDLATAGLEGVKWLEHSGRPWRSFTMRAKPVPLVCPTTAPAAMHA